MMLKTTKRANIVVDHDIDANSAAASMAALRAAIGSAYNYVTPEEAAARGYADPYAAYPGVPRRTVRDQLENAAARGKIEHILVGHRLAKWYRAKAEGKE
jgi:hypothetical protein